MLPPHAHRRILLLKENLETGGVHTVSDALAHALEAAGHRCDNQVITGFRCHWPRSQAT